MTGERIKQLRELHGYTQTSLAKKLGLSRSAVNAWEMGISIPSTQYLIELSSMFRVSVDFILEIKDTESIDISHLSDEEKSMIYTLIHYFSQHHHALDMLGIQGNQELDRLYEEQQ